MRRPCETYQTAVRRGHCPLNVDGTGQAMTYKRHEATQRPNWSPIRAATFALAIALMTSCGDKPNQHDLGEPPKPGPSQTPSSSVEPEDAVQIAVDMLQDQGWPLEPAQAVAKHNARYLRLLYEDDLPQFKKTIALFGRLGNDGHLLQRLTWMPELTGLPPQVDQLAADLCGSKADKSTC